MDEEKETITVTFTKAQSNVIAECMLAYVVTSLQFGDTRGAGLAAEVAHIMAQAIEAKYPEAAKQAHEQLRQWKGKFN